MRPNAKFGADQVQPLVRYGEFSILTADTV